MDLKKVGEKVLNTVRSAKSFSLLPSTSDRPEVPARALAAAAVARALAGLPPHQRLALSSNSGSLASLYVCGPRGERVELLEEDFYKEDFDPVRHTLENTPLEENDQNYFENKVSQRLVQLDVVMEQLSHQVMQHHEEMVSGMQLVMELEHDLQVANVICKNGRRHLSSSMHEVSRDLVITSNAKKKQFYLDLLPVLTQLQHALDIQSSLDSLVEGGNYSQAFQLLAEYLQLLDHFSELTAIQEMNRGIEVWVGRALEKLDSVLLGVCQKFNPESYITVIDAYALIGDISGLAEKLQNSFMQILLSETQTVLKDFVFQGVDSQAVEKKSRLTYNDLCLQLPETNFKHCLLRTLEVLFDLMCSYYAMMTWKSSEMEIESQCSQTPVTRKPTENITTEEGNELQIISDKPRRNGSFGCLPGQLRGRHSRNSSAPLTDSFLGQNLSCTDLYSVSKLQDEGCKFSSSQRVDIAEKDKLVSSAGEMVVDNEGQLTELSSSQCEMTPNKRVDDSAVYVNSDLCFDLRRESVCFVGQALDRGRKNFWQLITSRMSTLFSSDAVCSTSMHQFLQCHECVNLFIVTGEAFCGVEATQFRQKMKSVCENYFWMFHRQNMEALRIVLEKETWQQISPETIKAVNLAGLVGDGAPLLAPFDIGLSREPGLNSNHHSKEEESKELHAGFGQWSKRGNPFRHKKSPTARVDDSGLNEVSMSTVSYLLGKGSAGCVGNGTVVIGALGKNNSGNGNFIEGGEEEDENEDLLADFIDEDSQLPSRVSNPTVKRSTPSRNWKNEEIEGLTGSSVSLLRWMDKYARLMQKLETINIEFFKGICQLFEVYFYFVFKTFVQRDLSSGSRGSVESLNPRLRTALVRITQDLQEQRPKLQAAAAAVPASTNSSFFQVEVSPMSPMHCAPGPTKYYGLKERCTSAESISRIAQILLKSKMHLQSMLPQSALHSLEDFYAHTVDCMPDLKEHIFRTTARLLLNISGYVDRIANAKWELKDLGMEHNGYVDLLLGEFKHYKTKVANGGISKEDQEVLLEYGVDNLAETLVEGLSRVKRCTNEGRALMSLDLQVLINGLQHLASARIRSNLQIVETYIKAYYLPETEYIHWARAHPEYTKSQVIGLINLVASMNNWKRKARVELVEKIEASDL